LRVILLAFFFPLALYLLVLGLLNRRRSPLLLSGVWDGIGLLLGVSGFLLFAGPAVFSGLSERWRLYWLLGRGNLPLAGSDDAWRIWLLLSLLYFVLVVGGATFYLRRQRRLTAIYNAEPGQVEEALLQVCSRRGLEPVRSGDLFLFGFAPPSSSAIQTRPPEDKIASLLPLAQRERAAGNATAILELDSFPLMRHVTLRWDPTDSPLRTILERELADELAQTPSYDGLLGGWLLTLGFLLLAFELAGSFLLILLNLTMR
jgi:hypothetical protein